MALPAAGGTHRHRRTCTATRPACWPQVNSILAEHAVNVEGQLLGTRGEYGYLLTDIGVDYPDEVLAQLAAMDQTVRLRVLS